ncbi:MAG: HEPN domain-containing protein [Candidatus Hadarchaeota archaeon]
MDIASCLQEGYLQRVKVERDLIEKEFEEAEYDLKKARHALDDGDFKWSIIKSYYSMFHAARGVLFSIGLKERRHFAVRVVLEDLNARGKLENKFISDFSAALVAREDADYRYTYTQETASYLLEAAKDFLKKMEKMVG